MSETRDHITWLQMFIDTTLWIMTAVMSGSREQVLEHVRLGDLDPFLLTDDVHSVLDWLDAHGYFSVTSQEQRTATLAAIQKYRLAFDTRMPQSLYFRHYLLQLVQTDSIEHGAALPFGNQGSTWSGLLVRDQSKLPVNLKYSHAHLVMELLQPVETRQQFEHISSIVHLSLPWHIVTNMHGAHFFLACPLELSPSRRPKTFTQVAQLAGLFGVRVEER